jgi:PAS domain S-box-containing protein
MGPKESVGIPAGSHRLIPTQYTGWGLMAIGRLTSPSYYARKILRRGFSAWAITLCVVIFSIAALAPTSVHGQPRTVNVGVYQNKPKIFTDQNGRPAGILIELLDGMAAQEGWRLAYVTCEWANCLNALEDGRIDLMPDVAFSPERDAKYDFHKTPVLESWSRIYAAPSRPVYRTSELEGKRVAVLNGSIQQAAFEQMMTGFGYHATVVPTGSLEEAFALASNGSADAAIANHLFGDYFYQDYGLVKTTIVFNPVTLYYATAKGRNNDLLEAIDRHLNEWLREPNSTYYAVLSRWGEREPAGQVPQYVFWVFGGIAGLLVVAAGMILLLRQQVKVRTRHLEIASAELQKSEERYRTLARISPVGIFRTDPDGGTTYVNPKWREISGLSNEQAMGDGWLAAVHPDDRAKLSNDWRESTQQHETAFSDYRFVRADGTVVWVMGQAVPEMNAESQVVSYVGTITDITERKHAEEESRRRAGEFASLYEIAREITAEPNLSALLETITDRTARLLNTSDAVIYLYDSMRDELELAAANVYAQPRGTPFKVGAGVSSQVVRTRQPVIVDDYRTWSQRRPEFAPIDYRAVAQVPLIYRDEVIGVLGVAEIGTERRFSPADTRLMELLASEAAIAIQNVRLLAELEAYSKELEERVVARTEELRSAMRQAQEADRLKSAFLATMSHELRTPLNSIIGFTGVLLQGLAGPLNAEQTKQLGMARDSARHLLALINDVLDISKIEAGQLKVATAPFDMRAAIEEALRSVTPQAQRKGLSLAAAIGSKVGMVVSDQRRVEQILLNLLSNAVKFTERGEVRLECRVRDGWLETSVHDTGIGIQPDDLSRLFQPFHQLETGLNRRHDGTGLGLAICKNLVALLGGQISAKSEWGVGSTFTFTLPLASVASVASEGESHG